MTATSMAEKLLLYACISTIIRTEPSVVVYSRYDKEIMAKGSKAFRCAAFAAATCCTINTGTSQQEMGQPALGGVS